MRELQQLPMGPVRLLGFWASPDDRSLPDPADWVDAAWEVSEREWVADYLDRGQVAAAWMGASRCRLCSCFNGSRDLTDGAFLWPEGLSHYVLGHAVRLPAEFLDHIGQRLQTREEIARDGSWWRQQGART